MTTAHSPRTNLRERLTERVDGASLAVVRIAVGCALAWAPAKLWWADLIHLQFEMPAHHFAYPGFGWVAVPEGPWLRVLLSIIIVSGLALALGFRQRLAATIAFGSFSWLFLCEAARYLNHHYLMCLLALLFVFVPANGAWSIDAALRPGHHDGRAPRWAIWLLRFQLGVVYGFAGIAKLNADWLAGAPLDFWLLRSSGHVELLRDLRGWEEFPVVVAWAGMLFDLLVVPALLWRRTCAMALVAALVFHLANAHLFHIGVFPWLMLALTTIFLAPSWPRRLLRCAPVAPDHAPGGALRTSIAIGLAAWCAFQVLVPLRHWVYPGDVAWNEEGHRYAWRMKLRDKDSLVTFRVRNAATGEERDVLPPEFLTNLQSRNIDGRPDLIHQAALFLAESERANGGDVEVRVDALTSLNRRRPALLIDPDVDLAAEPLVTWGATPWLLELTEPLPQRSNWR